ncbi:ArsR/SmtB family transcription factor [Salibacter halophilus]|uniref:Winged helix-turn-helix transcriptional regulator n=1 Tax=Salibacter halophilus TaxID=1803916 RepID=A0A6N6M4F5_9FLAO|nr:metalloregulator ArsR/SmtB family transcription factor [Salibacter halophilus]KAB1064349.1 winged helix-turn-helix transcriptional regulator [Salibacter halophilus]
MGVTRTDLFTEEQNELAKIARILGHPARIAIVQHLARINACINSDLVQELGLAQATISQHLKELKNVGIIQGTVEGSSMSYCINPTKWNECKDLLTGLFDEYKNECC